MKHRLEHLHARTAAGAQRHDECGRLPEIGVNRRHAADDRHVRGRAGLDAPRRRRADDEEVGAREPRGHEWKDAVEEVLDRIAVREVAHQPYEQQHRRL